MPGVVAYLALLLLPPIAAACFASLRPQLAAALVMFGAILFLPTGVAYDFPLLPRLDREDIASICCALGVLLVARTEVRDRGAMRTFRFFAIITLGSYFGTVYTNPESLVVGVYRQTTLPGLTLHDAIAGVVGTSIKLLAPFYVGVKAFRTEKDLQLLLSVIALAGCLYIPLMLFEMRMSPNLHLWVYGYPPSAESFIQSMRGGGYRPVVFIGHGLGVAMFTLIALISAWSLVRAGRKAAGMGPTVPALALTGILPIIRSLGVLIYGMVFLPLFLLLSYRRQLTVVLVLAVVTALYPILRATQSFPNQAIVDGAALINEERASSLKYRFDNDELLLAHALKKPWFGWGGYNRGRPHDEWGRTPVIDGLWISDITASGRVGFFCRFGLFLWPVLAARRTVSRMRDREPRALLLGLTWICALMAVDCLVNAGFGNINLFLSGALCGLAAGMRASTARTRRIPSGLPPTRERPGPAERRVLAEPSS